MAAAIKNLARSYATGHGLGWTPGREAGPRRAHRPCVVIVGKAPGGRSNLLRQKWPTDLVRLLVLGSQAPVQFLAENLSFRLASPFVDKAFKSSHIELLVSRNAS